MVAARFRDQGLDFETRQCHMWRFFEVLAFLQNHKERLHGCGLIRDMDDDPAGLEISETLFRVLATARYEGVRLQAGDPVPTFHVDSVIEAAKTIRADED